MHERHELTFVLKRLPFAKIRLAVHSSATEAHEAWRDYGMEDYGRLRDHICEDDALSDALQLAWLPVLKGARKSSRTLYEVIGRFHALNQIEALRPEIVTLLVLSPPKGAPWDYERLRALAQAMLVLEASGRDQAVPEFRAILRATKATPWLGLKRRRRRRASLAGFVGCHPDRLRERAGRDRAGQAPKIWDELGDG